MNRSFFRLSTGALVAIAIGLGAVAGAVWIYGKGAPSGNGETAQNIAIAPGDTAGTCESDAGKLATLKALSVGDMAAMGIQNQARSLPPLSFNDIDGAAKTLADFRGQSLLVNIWATWCAPCRAEMPALAKLEAELGGDDFKVLAINIDRGDVEKPRSFLAEIGVSNLGLYRDETMGVFNTLKKEGLAFGLPVTLMVDGNGCLLGAMNGPAEWAGPDAQALVGALTGKPATALGS